MSYRHTQRGTLLVLWMIVLAAGLTVAGLRLSPLALITVPILLLSGWLFHSLTITIQAGELRWSFGPGLISKSVPLSEVVAAHPVRTNFVEGWGIHLSRYGWLYNVSGRDAVAVTLKDGKRFALGTDEPEALTDAILQAAQLSV
jgi:hypothetical protein